MLDYNSIKFKKWSFNYCLSKLKFLVHVHPFVLCTITGIIRIYKASHGHTSMSMNEWVAGAPEFLSRLALDLGHIIWVFLLKWLLDKMALLEVSYFFFSLLILLSGLVWRRPVKLSQFWGFFFYLFSYSPCSSLVTNGILLSFVILTALVSSILVD